MSNGWIGLIYSQIVWAKMRKDKKAIKRWTRLAKKALKDNHGKKKGVTP